MTQNHYHPYKDGPHAAIHHACLFLTLLTGVVIPIMYLYADQVALLGSI